MRNAARMQVLWCSRIGVGEIHVLDCASASNQWAAMNSQSSTSCISCDTSRTTAIIAPNGRRICIDCLRCTRRNEADVQERARCRMCDEPLDVNDPCWEVHGMQMCNACYDTLSEIVTAEDEGKRRLGNFTVVQRLLYLAWELMHAVRIVVWRVAIRTIKVKSRSKRSRVMPPE